MARRHYLLALSLLAATSALTLPAFSALAAEPTIALVQINQQALFFTQMNEGAEKKAEELGAKLVIFNANNDPAAQNNAIETYIAEKVDGLVVVAIDTNGIMPAVEAAADGRHPGGRRRRHPAGRPADGAGRRRQRGGRHARSASISSRSTGRWAAGQARHRRRAELDHPERPPEGLRGRREGGARASPWPASSTGGTSRTTPCRRPRT